MRNADIAELLEDYPLNSKSKMELVWVSECVIPVEDVSTSYLENGLEDIINNLGLHYKMSTREKMLYSQNLDLIEDMVDAIRKKDEKKMGLLYGFPECCVDHYIRQDGSAYEKNEEAIKQRLKNGFPIANYFRDYVHCLDCLSNHDSPSGKLETKMAKVLEKDSPKLHREFRDKKSGERVLYKTSDGREHILLVGGTSERIKDTKRRLEIF